MANPSSYAWSEMLIDAVPVGEEAEVSTPGFETPENYLTDELEVVHQGQVLRPEQYTFTWEDDFSHVHVVNETEADWPPQTTLYVTVAGKPFDASNVEDSFTALENRVTQTEAKLADHESRIAALEQATPPVARSEARETSEPKKATVAKKTTTTTVAATQRARELQRRRQEAKKSKGKRTR